jgi:MFS family permease
MLIAPILVPFFAFYGQDLQEIFLLESVYAVVILAMELPSGYLADRFGRVAALRLGGVFWSAGWILLLIVEDFAGLVVFEVLMGLGSSLLSWAIAGSALLFAARGLFSVLFMDALNRRIEDDYRATINSLIGFGFRSAFVLTAPILGFVFDGFGLWVTVYALMSMAGVIAGVLLFPLARGINA